MNYQERNCGIGSDECCVLHDDWCNWIVHFLIEEGHGKHTHTSIGRHLENNATFGPWKCRAADEEGWGHPIDYIIIFIFFKQKPSVLPVPNSSECELVEEETRNDSNLFATRSVPTDEDEPLLVLLSSSTVGGSDQIHSRQNSTAMSSEDGGSSSSGLPPKLSKSSMSSWVEKEVPWRGVQKMLLGPPVNAAMANFCLSRIRLRVALCSNDLKH